MWATLSHSQGTQVGKKWEKRDYRAQILCLSTMMGGALHLEDGNLCKCELQKPESFYSEVVQLCYFNTRVIEKSHTSLTAAKWPKHKEEEEEEEENEEEEKIYKNA